eukprot:360993_1
MSAELECCPSWLAYLGAFILWFILIGAGIWSIYLGKTGMNIVNEFKREATKEDCLIIDWETIECSCGADCYSWTHIYKIETDKCPNNTLDTGNLV